MRKKILVIDDEVMILDAMKLILEDMDYMVTGISDPLEGIDEIDGHPDGDRLRDEARTRELAELDRDLIPEINGTVQVRIVDNDMKAVADFYPPSKNGRDVTVDDVMDTLTSLDVVFGINRGSIEAAVTRCSEERGTLHPGVYVEICHIAFINTRERRNMRLHLDKNGDRILVEQI